MLQAQPRIVVAPESSRRFCAPEQGPAHVIGRQVVTAGDQAVPGGDCVAIGAAQVPHQTKPEAGRGGCVETWEPVEQLLVSGFGLIRLGQALERLAGFHQRLCGDFGVLVGIVGEGIQLAQGVGLIARRKTRQGPVQPRGGYIGPGRVDLQILIERRHGVAVVHGEVPRTAKHERIDLVGGAEVVEQPQGVGRSCGGRELVQCRLERLHSGVPFTEIAADLSKTEQLLAKRACARRQGQHLAMSVERGLVVAELGQRLGAHLEQALPERPAECDVQSPGSCVGRLARAASIQLTLGNLEPHGRRDRSIGASVVGQRLHGLGMLVGRVEGQAARVRVAPVGRTSRQHLQGVGAATCQGQRERE